jgi:hypothetical protein
MTIPVIATDRIILWRKGGILKQNKSVTKLELYTPGLEIIY